MPKNNYSPSAAAGRERTKSIAKRLNGALTRRKFARALLVDLLVAAIVIVTWCGVTESFYGGTLLSSKRSFTNIIEPLIDNTVMLINRNFSVEVEETVQPYAPSLPPSDAENDGQENPNASETIVTQKVVRRLPFSGVYYIFDVKISPPGADLFDKLHVIRIDSNSVSYISPQQAAVDAAPILTCVTAALLIVIFLQTVGFVLSQFTGRGFIKKYLRPIDDIALAAERLSAVRHSTDGAEVRAENRSDSEDTLAHAIAAIDDIDDSCSRINMSESELGGLEAAINNMLRRLDEAKRKQIRFVDDASHELRTPIAVIQGYANMLDRWGKNDPQVMDEAISAIKTESEHMKTLIDQLLFLARGEMDRHVIEKEALDAAQIIEEIFDESMMLDAAHEYEIASPLPRQAQSAPSDIGESDAEVSSPMMISADAAMIKQAIRVLRDNAVKYTPEGGTITFKVYERGAASSSGNIGERSVCIEISDNGMGIRPEELSRIFDRFYRGSNVRSSSASGSGLGLSIAKWITEEHGGHIEAISSPGFGSKMTIVLPAAEKNE